MITRQCPVPGGGRGLVDRNPYPNLPNESLQSRVFALYLVTPTCRIQNSSACRGRACAKRDHGYIQLQELGYVVLTASNGLEALRVAEEYGGPIDVLLTDLVMPNMNGRQLGDLLHQKFPQLKILFVSGYADDVVFRAGHLDVGTAFVQKPFSQMILGQQLRGLFESQERSAADWFSLCWSDDVVV